MNTAERLKIASILLSYPTDATPELLAAIRAGAEESRDDAVLSAVDALATVTLSALQRVYVAAFDLQESTALYLTSHELGDSRERGGALLRLHALLRSAALEPREGELPDYIPLLLEFLAEKPEGMPTDTLEDRLAVVCSAILRRLAKENPYRGLLAVVCDCLPDTAGSNGDGAAGDRLSKPIVEPDIDELPYPLVYD